MNIPEEHKKRYVYHFTHLSNLESIIKNGLLCTNKKNKANILHKNIAAQSIQERRSEMDVKCKKTPRYMIMYLGILLLELRCSYLC